MKVCVLPYHVLLGCFRPSKPPFDKADSNYIDPTDKPVQTNGIVSEGSFSIGVLYDSKHVEISAAMLTNGIHSEVALKLRQRTCRVQYIDYCAEKH